MAAPTDQPLSRDAFLAHVGELAEEIINVDGLGKVLVREITGAQRANLLGVLSSAADDAKGKAFETYQELLLQLGLLDPNDKQPLLDVATRGKAMQLGASKVAALVEAIERLSGLSAKAPESAEKNSVTTASSSASSG